MERYRDELASDPHEALLIDNIFYPINTSLAAGQAMYSFWQGFGSTWDDTSGEMHGYMIMFHWQRRATSAVSTIESTTKAMTRRGSG